MGRQFHSLRELSEYSGADSSEDFSSILSALLNLRDDQPEKF